MESEEASKPVTIRLVRLRHKSKRIIVIGLIGLALASELLSEDIAKFITVPSLVSALLVEAGIQE